jgi:hypothetical protein
VEFVVHDKFKAGAAWTILNLLHREANSDPISHPWRTQMSAGLLTSLDINRLRMLTA